MDFSVSSLLAGFIYGVAGLYLLKLGRKSANFAHIAIGLVLMIYPYFVEGAFLIWGIGTALLIAAYWLRQS